MPELFPTDAIHSALSPEIASVYSRCLSSEPRSIEALRQEMAEYVNDLRARSSLDSFLDLSTAERVGRGCARLLDLLEQSGSAGAHAAVQAAVVYFILEDDAEADSSIIGFDDDLQVVVETFKALGWSNGGVLA